MVNGSGNGARSGAQTLALLAVPRNVLILQALGDGPKQQMELRREAGSPAQSTLRSHLANLERIGSIVRRRSSSFPGAVEYELAEPGKDLLFVAATLERWLAASPEKPLELGSDRAKAAIKALAEGWSTSMLRALAAQPLSLTELNRVIGDLSYPSLERRLGALRLAGMVEAMPSNGRGTPYAVTDWLRRGTAPLVAAARWERRNAADTTTPIGRLDIEAAFLLAVPKLRLADDESGSCRMAVEISNGRERRLAGVLVEVAMGKIASCTSRLQGNPDAWALGSAMAWFSAVIDADSDRLELGGNCPLARALVSALHRTLFRPARDPDTLIREN